MKVHFREQYGSRGEEILYVTPAGTSANSGASEFLKRSITWPYAGPGIYWPAIRMLRTAAFIQWHLFFISSFFSFLSFFVIDQDTIVRVPLKRSTGSDQLIIKENFGLYRLFQKIFLPQGYPDSVSEDYIYYQLWDTLQAFCSTISGQFWCDEIF